MKITSSLGLLLLWGSLLFRGCGPIVDPPNDDDVSDDDDAGDDDDVSDDDDSAADPWEALHSAVEASSLADVTVLIGTAEGELFLHEKGSSTVDQVYLLASASKWLSSLTSLRMVEEGVLSLADRPQDYLSWWTSDPSDPRSEVTLEQLLSFTSGFSGDTGLGPGEQGVDCVEDAEMSLDSCAQEIYENFFTYEPGSTFHYGPAHLQVAAAMAAATKGVRWNALFRQYIGQPNGLAVTTAFALPSLDNPRAAGGGTASARDYGTLLTALAAGELLSAESVNLLSADHTPEGVVIGSAPDVATDGGSWHYALGCWRECNEETYTEACEEAAVLSSPGAFGFYPWWDSARGFWGIVATQLALGEGGASTTVPLGQAWAELAAEALEASP